MTTLAEPYHVCWTRDEYYKMDEIGLFNHRHVELINGQIMERGPLNPLCATAITIAGDRLRKMFASDHFVRIQCPLDLAEMFQPTPDVAAVVGEPHDYSNAHPTTAPLVVEVAEASLIYDRTTKTSLYAQAGIAEYWIVNLVDRQLEVFRQPRTDAAALYGFNYGERLILTEGDTVTPLARPEAQLAVSDLLP